LYWTKECKDSLESIASSEKHDKTSKIWKGVRDEKIGFIGELTRLVRKPT
jgi:hypothetical protein